LLDVPTRNSTSSKLANTGDGGGLLKNVRWSGWTENRAGAFTAAFRRPSEKTGVTRPDFQRGLPRLPDFRRR
jgi:hypothetical protein